MRKLAVILCLIGGAAYAQLGHDLLQFPGFTISSNTTTVVTNPYPARGVASAVVLYTSGAGPLTSTVTSVRSDGTRTLSAASAVASGTPFVSNLTAYALFDEKVVLSVTAGATMTGTATVAGFVLYEK